MAANSHKFMPCVTRLIHSRPDDEDTPCFFVMMQLNSTQQRPCCPFQKIYALIRFKGGKSPTTVFSGLAFLRCHVVNKENLAVLDLC